MSTKIKTIRNVFDPNRKIEVPLIDVRTVDLTNLAKKKDTVTYRGAPAHFIMNEVREWARLHTLEGAMSMPERGVWILVGVKNEPWFISYPELFASYRGVDENRDHPGWTDFVPLGAVRQTGLVQFKNGFAIYGEYGEIAEASFEENGKERFIMFSKGPSSYVVHDPASPTNYWLVEPTIYLKTYDPANQK